MGIPIPQILGKTPDSVQSTNVDRDMNSRYVWYFRDRNTQGLHTKIEPSGDGWSVVIYNVEWDGKDYVEDNKPEVELVQENFNEAICCAEQETQRVVDNNDEYNELL